MVNGPEKKVTIDAVIRAVAERFSLQPSSAKAENERLDSLTRGRSRCTSRRNSLTLLCRRSARAFGGKHHTTVLHSIEKIEQMTQVRRGFEQDHPQHYRLITINLVAFSTGAPHSGCILLVEHPGGGNFRCTFQPDLHRYQMTRSAFDFV